MFGRWRVVSAACAALIAVNLPRASADKPELVSGQVREVIRPAVGFIDDPVAVDGAGSRLVYLRSTPEGEVTAVLYDLEQRAELLSVPIDRWIKRPTHVAVGAERMLVVGAEADKRERGIVIDRRGKVVRRYGPATRIRLTEYRGQLVVSIYRRTSKRKTVTHEVEARSLATGRRINRRGRLVLDASGTDRERELEVNHWRREHLIAVGVKAGGYDRGEDQQMPNFVAHWDLTRRKVVKRAEIADLIAQRRRAMRLAKHPNRARFITATRDRSEMTATSPAGDRAVTLAHPLTHYDPDTLMFHEHGGKLYFSIQIDPVHPDAVAKRRAVRPWLDLYELADGATRAIRKARLMPEKNRELRWLATSDLWILAPEHRGFDRGGPELRIIKL